MSNKYPRYFVRTTECAWYWRLDENGVMWREFPRLAVVQKSSLTVKDIEWLIGHNIWREITASEAAELLKGQAK